MSRPGACAGRFCCCCCFLPTLAAPNTTPCCCRRPPQPLRLNFLDVATGPSFHRCVYLLVAKEAALMEAGAAARQAYDLAAAQPPGEFMPHCSLLYAQLEAQARAAAAAAAVARLYGEGADYGTLLTDAGCTCDALTLWYTPADDTSLASWSQVAEFKLGDGGGQDKGS